MITADEEIRATRDEMGGAKPNTLLMGKEFYNMLMAEYMKMFRRQRGRDPVILRNPWSGEVFWMEMCNDRP